MILKLAKCRNPTAHGTGVERPVVHRVIDDCRERVKRGPVFRTARVWHGGCNTIHEHPRVGRLYVSSCTGVAASEQLYRVDAAFD